MKNGLAETSQETITAPKMYVEMEQEENVARGYVMVTEILAYKATKEPRRYTPERPGLKGEIMKNKDGKTMYVEVSSKPYFCQTKEQEIVFIQNHPGMRIETHSIQLLKSTAIKYINSPRNMEAFKEKE